METAIATSFTAQVQSVTGLITNLRGMKPDAYMREDGLLMLFRIAGGFTLVNRDNFLSVNFSPEPLPVVNGKPKLGVVTADGEAYQANDPPPAGPQLELTKTSEAPPVS